MTKVLVVPKPGDVSVCKMATLVLTGSYRKRISLCMKLVCVSVHSHVLKSSRLGVTGGCEQPNVGTEN